MSNELKATPGPWGLTREGKGFSVRSVGTMENGYTSEHICSMDYYRIDREGEMNPNAHLIAAAPDMYQELLEIRDWMGSYNVTGKYDAEIYRIDCVLSKARGEKS